VEDATTLIERADGAAMAFRRVGRGRALVCLAGGPGADARYLEELAGLADDHQLIIPDARGTGASDPAADPSGYAFDALAEDIESLRRRLGLDRMRLLAHSAACTTALVYASQHPDRLEALVLVAPSRWLYEDVPDDTDHILERRRHEAWYPDVAAAMERLATGPGRGQVPGLLAAIAPASYARWGWREQAHAATMVPENLDASRLFWAADVDGAVVRGRLGLVAAPVLVITGGLDSATGVNAGAAWASCFANGRHVLLEGSAHHPWVDDPAAFAGEIRRFLDQTSESPPAPTLSS
jgi:proline iminopeptidase